MLSKSPVNCLVSIPQRKQTSVCRTVLEEVGNEIEEDEDDPCLLEDSIYHLKLSQNLREFLLNFSTHHCFPAYVQHLNIPERKVLSGLNINTSFM